MCPSFSFFPYHTSCYAVLETTIVDLFAPVEEKGKSTCKQINPIYSRARSFPPFTPPPLLPDYSPFRPEKALNKALGSIEFVVLCMGIPLFFE